MKHIQKLITLILFCTIMLQAKAAIVEKEITYKAGEKTMKGYLAYDDANKKAAPAVLVVHEWWGLTEYPKMRARMLAELGYVAFCVDMFGEGKIADNIADAQKYSGEVYSSPAIIKERFMAAYNEVIKQPQVDKNKIAAIGYCFGGTVVLNAATMGIPLVGVVSFHGGLAGIKASKDLLKAKILVCHGGADKFVSEEDIVNFKKQMEIANASYDFKVYEGGLHAFTNPKSTENGKKFGIPIAYNEAADIASWKDMKAFLKKVF